MSKAPKTLFIEETQAIKHGRTNRYDEKDKEYILKSESDKEKVGLIAKANELIKAYQSDDWRNDNWYDKIDVLRTEWEQLISK